MGCPLFIYRSNGHPLRTTVTLVRGFTHNGTARSALFNAVQQHHATRLSTFGIYDLLHDAHGRQTHQLTASASVTIQPNAAANAHCIAHSGAVSKLLLLHDLSRSRHRVYFKPGLVAIAVQHHFC